MTHHKQADEALLLSQIIGEHGMPIGCDDIGDTALGKLVKIVYALDTRLTNLEAELERERLTKGMWT